MSQLTVTPVIYRKNKEEHQEASIAIRVTYQGKSRHKATDYRSVIAWFNDEAGLVTKQHPLHEVINASISKERYKIHEDLLILKKQPDFSLQTIEHYLQPDSKVFRKSFTSFVLQYIKDCEKSGGTVGNYRKQLNKIHRFAEKDNLSFSEINKDFLTRYRKWLKEPGERGEHKRKKLPNSANTIYDSLTKFIQKFFNEAKVPVPDFEFPKPVDSNPTYLTMDELDSVEALLPSLPPDLYNDAIYFLLECYSGIRHSDWTKFKVEKLISGENFKVRAKKNGEPIYISLQQRPRLRAVLEKIKDLPYTGTLDTTNQNLKIIGALAGFKKKLTTHVGRHTCAVLHAELGYSMEYVAELLGISLATAKVYYKITRRKLLEEEKRIGKGL